MNVPILKIIIIILSCSMSSGCVKASPPIVGTYEKIDRPTVQQIDLTADRTQASAFRSDPKIDCHVLQPDFCIAMDKMLTDVGTLNVAFQGKFGVIKTNGKTTLITNEVSIVPYTVISTVNNSIVFSFTQGC
jgi:hypothetical protein